MRKHRRRHNHKNDESWYSNILGFFEQEAIPIVSAMDDDDDDDYESKVVGFIERLLGPKAGRENHLFCGCCCDTRRATIVVNLVSLFVDLYAMMVAFMLIRGYTNSNANNTDETIQHKNQMAAWLTTAVVDFFVLLAVAMHATGIYGALKYSPTAIKVAAAAHGITIIVSVFTFDAIGTIAGGVFLYPHIILIKEIDTGVMTDYNYENIRACCVC